MGWFLSDKPKKKTSKKKSAPRQSPLRWDRAKVLGGLRWTGWVVFIAALAAGWYFGEQRLRAQVAHDRSALPVVELADLPPWMEPWLVDDLRRSIAAAIDPNPLDQLSLQEVYHDLEMNPWVRSVHSVERRAGGVIRITAAYRRPTALIETDEGYCLVDAEGVCLPGVYNSIEASKLPYTVLVNVSSRAPVAGELWPGGDVQAGLMLARTVTAQRWRDQVAAIDVGNFDGRSQRAEPHLVLLTRRGGKVRWGRAPGANGFYEPEASVKLSHIERIRQQSNPRGLIDAGGAEVDVFGDVPFIHDALAQRR